MMVTVEGRGEYVYGNRAIKKSTYRAYENTWSNFVAWCSQRGYKDPYEVGLDSIVDYISMKCGFRSKACGYVLCAIAYFYREKGYPFDSRYPAFRPFKKEYRAQKSRSL